MDFNSRYKFLIGSVLVFIGIGLFSALTAFAVGGGGGGSVPSCNVDQWDCTGWSQCSLNGTQTRNCSLTYDCPTADTPKPAESQSCAPPTAPSSVAPQVEQRPASSAEQSPKNKIETQKKIESQAPACTKDVWTCSAWGQTCDIYGREQRTCKLSFDCPNVQTPPPPESQPCQKLQCGNKSAIRDRIFCRLNLTPAGAARELELQYLPEACRVKNGTEQKECINLYKSFEPCWNVKQGEERFSCARNVLKLGPSASDEVKTCKLEKLMGE